MQQQRHKVDDESSHVADTADESSQVKDAAGLAPNIEALHQVFGHERDIVIARSVALFIFNLLVSTLSSHL